MNEWFPVVGATKEERLVSRMAMSRASFCKVVVAWLVSKFEVDPDLFVGVEEVSCLSLVSDLMLSRQTIDRLTAWLAKRIEGSAKHDVSFGVCRTVGDLADAALQACDAQDRIEQANEREFLMHARMRELRLQCQKSADDDHSRVERVAFRVATFNVDAFASQSSIATASVCRSIRRAVESGCDVLCLQEVTALWKERMQADGCIKSFRYAEFHFDDRTGAGGLAVCPAFQSWIFKFSHHLTRFKGHFSHSQRAKSSWEMSICKFATFICVLVSTWIRSWVRRMFLFL
jgi:hypothetical protein